MAFLFDLAVNNFYDITYTDSPIKITLALNYTVVIKSATFIFTITLANVD